MHTLLFEYILAIGLSGVVQYSALGIQLDTIFINKTFGILNLEINKLMIFIKRGLHIYAYLFVVVR